MFKPSYSEMCFAALFFPPDGPGSIDELYSNKFEIVQAEQSIVTVNRENKSRRDLTRVHLINSVCLFTLRLARLPLDKKIGIFCSHTATE